MPHLPGNCPEPASCSRGLLVGLLALSPGGAPAVLCLLDVGRRGAQSVSDAGRWL